MRFKDGSIWRFRTSDGLLVSQTDRNGNTVLIARDSQGRVTALTEPAGRQLTFSYTGTILRIDRITDPLGRTVQYTYDGQGRLTNVTDPAGGSTQYTYDANHRLLTITDPRGITFLTNEYDSAGRVIRQTQADGGVFTFEYTMAGGFITSTKVTDPRGNTAVSRFNADRYLVSRTDALGQTTTLERQPGTNLLLSTTDPLGRVTRFAYDSSGNVTTITDPLGNTRTFTYDSSFNKVTSITDPLANLTTFEYDSQGNLIAITDPEQNLKPPAERLKTTFTYNAAGQPLTTTDPLGNTSTFTYDSNGNLTAITDPLGKTTERSYDLVSRLIAETDAVGRTTRFSYDPLDRQVTIADALNGISTFGYDPNGNLLTVTDARGNTTTHDYDSMGRLNRRIDQLGRAETFTYDGNANLVSTADRKNQMTNFTYDPLNRRVRSEYADGAVATFQYDAAGRLLQANDTVDPHGPVAVGYDTLDRVVSEVTALGTVSYGYDTRSRRTAMTVSGQPPVSYTYDAASKLRTIRQDPLNPVDILYDALGRRTLLTLPNGLTTEYQYDSASRLTALIYRNANGVLSDLTYQYDPSGNRTTMGGSIARTLLPDSVASATYDAANRQLTFGSRSLTHDANGNLTILTDGGNTTTYTWDARDRLTAIAGLGLTASFAYDAVGRRAQKTTGGQTTTYQYDGLDIIREVLVGSSIITLRGLGLDEPLIRTEAGLSSAYLRDALGSVLALTAGDGTVNTTYTYGPFGQTSEAGLPSTNALQYTGREQDGTGLYYFRARYYSPALHRFLGEDPIGLAGGFVNLYVYVGNNPLILVDLTGLAPSSDNPTRTCVGRARVLLGNPRHIGRTTGAFSPRPITPTSAAVIPRQFGGRSTGGLRPYVGQIRGNVGGVFQFTDVADVIAPPSAREKLQQLNPDTLIIELPGAESDLGTTGVVIIVPAALPCPTGTTEAAPAGP
jgi:RHS repeat-associated protein